METFQKPLSSHYENSGKPLYNAEDMRKFSEIHAPGLFDVLLSSILRDDSRLSEDRKTLQTAVEAVKFKTAGAKNSCSSPYYDIF